MVFTYSETCIDQPPKNSAITVGINDKHNPLFSLDTYKTMTYKQVGNVYLNIISDYDSFKTKSCDVNDEVAVRAMLGQDPVVKQFLKNHPSASFQHYKTYNDPGNSHTFSELQHDGLRLKVIISKHDDNDGNCHRIGGYFVEYDLPNSGTSFSTKTTQHDAERWNDAISAVNDLTNPLKQMKMGIPIYAIKCKEGLYPIPKVDRITPACVTDEANSKLLSRGWTPLRIGMPAEKNVLVSYDAKMVFPYKVTKEFDPRSPYFSMVYWVNNDIVPHTIVAKDGSWKKLAKLTKPYLSLSVQVLLCHIF